ncbi:hypothetical protein HML84_07805 [Alcanivorax sp. IO_7]|nr:hypothetical protein HML84_07805 [Alcanivorax sp. IO_7]
MLASERKADFATDTDNLALTDRSINASMKDFEKNEWKDKDRGDGVSNSEFYDVDEKRLQSELEKAGKARAEHLPGNREKAGYYIGESARTGVSEGAKMGLQQALGILMVEFFSSSLLEIRSAFRNGLEGKGLIDDLKIRLGRVASGLAEKEGSPERVFRWLLVRLSVQPGHHRCEPFCYHGKESG